MKQYSFYFKIFLFSFIIQSCSNHSINPSLCDKYNVYYNSVKHYYLVSKKNTPSGSFYIWKTTEGYYLVKWGLKLTDNSAYHIKDDDTGPFKQIDEAIKEASRLPYYNIYTWSEFYKKEKSLVEKETNYMLEKLCD